MGVWEAPTCLIGGLPCHCFLGPGFLLPQPPQIRKDRGMASPAELEDNFDSGTVGFRWI